MSKVAVVTGCSSGFGLLGAVELARSGYEVVATMRDTSRQADLLQAAAEAGVRGRITVMELDVTDHAQLDEVVHEVLARFERIDVLVNNAGFALGGFADEVPLSKWREQFETNVFGLIAMTQAVIPTMRSNRRGRIIQLGSISGLVGFPGLSPYNASKHAVEGFSEALRHELRPHDVYVSIVEPGSYQTSIWEKGLSEMSSAAESAQADRLQALRTQVEATAASAGDPHEVARLIARIAEQPKPRLRYPIGKGIHATLFAKRMLPWRIWERLVSR